MTGLETPATGSTKGVRRPLTKGYVDQLIPTSDLITSYANQVVGVQNNQTINNFERIMNSGGSVLIRWGLPPT